MKILITSTSFQNLQGKHFEVLYQIPNLEIKMLKGPLTLDVTLAYADEFDGIICGDDEYNEAFFKKAQGKLKILSKYGVGLDKIDLEAARKYNIPVKSCPGINSTTVAEHVFALLLTYSKRIIESCNNTKKGNWDRPTGIDLLNKNIGIIGFGNIGQEVAKRATAFGMSVFFYDPFSKYSEGKYQKASTLSELVSTSDIISLHTPLNEATKNLLNFNNLSASNKKPIIINTARGGLISEPDILALLENNFIECYLTDVLEIEPIDKHNKLKNNSKILITPHIGSRTVDNIYRQALKASENLLQGLNIE